MRCGGKVAAADEHVATVEQVAEWLAAGSGGAHSYFTCAPEVTDVEVLTRIATDGLGGRPEPGKDEL